MHPLQAGSDKAQTNALREALHDSPCAARRADLLFLEAWERAPAPSVAATLRVSQIRRANPDLAAAIRAEIDGGRALSALERAAFAAIATPLPKRPC